MSEVCNREVSLYFQYVGVVKMNSNTVETL